MKILSVESIREADAYTIRHEPVADIDLMERAATACLYWLTDEVSHEKTVFVAAGPGNNGGDGLAIARMLRAKEYDVRVMLAGDPDQLSPSCQTNLERWLSLPGAEITEPARWNPGQDSIVIDALLGSGLARPAEGDLEEWIRRINDSGALVISIDIPSGLFCDRTLQGRKDPAVVRAAYTLTFAPLKLAFLFPENGCYTGEWVLLDIGISQEYLDRAVTRNFFTEAGDIASLLRKRSRFQHKGHFGHALLICGSRGKMGAAVLAARGCLRAGAGLTTVSIPASGLDILQTAVPEAMAVVDPGPAEFTTVPDLSPYNAIAVGPGIGTGPSTQKALKSLIQTARIPLIFDADAINILAENKTWLSFVPKGSVFTPHPKEFERLAGKSTDDFDRNQRQRDFSFKYQCHVVLKGAHTAITSPEGNCWFNSTGNPGMATGGSGDVLTGIIAGLAARGYSLSVSSRAGVYLHGLAGDLAVSETGMESMAAGDLVHYLGKAFQTLYGEL